MTDPLLLGPEWQITFILFNLSLRNQGIPEEAEISHYPGRIRTIWGERGEGKIWLAVCRAHTYAADTCRFISVL